MSEQTIFNISTEIHDQHLQVRLNDRSIFCLNKPTAERYQLTLEQDAGNYVIWMRQSNNGFARLYSTEDRELASLIMNTTADVLTRMAITASQPHKASTATIPKWKSYVLAGTFLSLVVAIGMLTLSSPHGVENTPAPVAPPVQPVPPAVAAATPTMTVPQTQGTQVQGAPSLSPEAAAEARALLAERLKNGAAKQEFTIRLSSGHERSLYIFLDPECPNCRIFEPTVQALAEDYNVEIFPVTLIGKTRTADKVVPLLCATPEKRAQMWKALNDTGAGMLNLAEKEKASIAPAACDAGKLALARNDLAFELYRMPGTPTVISDDGRMIPLQAMSSDTALKSFLDTRQ